MERLATQTFFRFARDSDSSRTTLASHASICLISASENSVVSGVLVKLAMGCLRRKVSQKSVEIV